VRDIETPVFGLAAIICARNGLRQLADRYICDNTLSMQSKTLEIHTPTHQAMVPVTHAVQAALDAADPVDGLLHIAVAHTTCGMLVNENADPDVVTDLLRRLAVMVPWEDPADRHAEGNTAAHLRSILVGHSVTLPVRNGRLALGTWQGIFLAEFDGPRRRRVTLTVIG